MSTAEFCTFFLQNGSLYNQSAAFKSVRLIQRVNPIRRKTGNAPKMIGVLTRSVSIRFKQDVTSARLHTCNTGGTNNDTEGILGKRAARPWHS